LPRRAAGAGRRDAAAVSIDLVCLRPVGGRLAVFAPRGGGSLALPHLAPDPDEPLAKAVRRLASGALGLAPGFLEQVGAFGAGHRHPAGAVVSVAYVALLPPDPAADAGVWVPASAPGGLVGRQRAMVQGALTLLRDRVERAPVAFHLLPERFTLTELQHSYELVLGRRLHKASFRRALQGAALVAPTDIWRAEGRGRPAQMYRYSPEGPRDGAHPLRFDFGAR
jgi:8-oxo-dGTP diphosphatase